jgi:four helix bundle protein
MEELPVIALSCEVYKKLLVLTAAIDRKYRYTLGEQVVASCRDVLQQLILAKHAPKPLKINYLNAATAAAELTAMQLRAILELNLANETNCLKLQAKITETRRMLGGWRKSLM